MEIISENFKTPEKTLLNDYPGQSHSRTFGLCAIQQNNQNTYVFILQTFIPTAREGGLLSTISYYTQYACMLTTSLTLECWHRNVF